MILSNFYKFLHAYIIGGVATARRVSGDYYDWRYQNKPYNNHTAALCPKDIMGNVITTLEAEGVCFGTGAVEPTKNDYTLSGDLITGISASVSITQEDNFTYDPQTITAKYTITNDNTQAITIREVMAVCKAYADSRYQYYAYFAIDRTVLDNPVTIEPGGVGVVEYTIALANPYQYNQGEPVP